ncbi:DegT/DnrJ/EryC1/StrS family aminotransferase [Phnomibacter ginsenosidimutans]|uniref:Aminotransferase class I/II-fold pyridoxal phosphate-dependent enzyme n=1 Tax=Phnomibacter ginsenosidimutans TaxID=2676868 RepID=A0A6I6G7T1_9BACT|nr:DegT/DnrJ/EryC1/StrS family aminotransferase [Phnomibacter ginsenosidimutans]QGW28264.1 aminotransferase class I/II-fold pyridoxal phosphate-dependent enzyme [Phnomibacter ginsenosidimutans]
MSTIQMVDLHTQYKKIKDEVDRAVIDVLESSAFINGKPVAEFAQSLAQYLGVKHVIPCANGTDALQIALMSLDLQPGDEVITPSFTYVATTEVVALLRLKPVFVEVDPRTFCMDPERLEAAITPRTKAIVPVHLYGHAAPMKEILEIAAKHNLPVIEDTAQAMGADYIFPDGTKAKAGTMGTIGCTSFFPSKNLGCYGDGGAMFTNDDALADKLRMIANHGQKVRYYHDLVGCNSRLDTIQAAILNIKLRNLETYNAARIAAADTYDKLFAAQGNIQTPYRAEYTRHVFHQYTLQLEGVDRDGMVNHLASKGIPSMIYYPVPAHRQKMFDAFGGSGYELPVTDWLTNRVISLPMHSELTLETQQYIANAVIEFAQQ